jgi:hypothetical protein
MQILIWDFMSCNIVTLEVLTNVLEEPAASIFRVEVLRPVKLCRESGMIFQGNRSIGRCHRGM